VTKSFSWVEGGQQVLAEEVEGVGGARLLEEAPRLLLVAGAHGGEAELPAGRVVALVGEHGALASSWASR
jgi:hypothetical protein